MNSPLPIPDLWDLHPCASITGNQRLGNPRYKTFSMPIGTRHDVSQMEPRPSQIKSHRITQKIQVLYSNALVNSHCCHTKQMSFVFWFVQEALACGLSKTSPPGSRIAIRGAVSKVFTCQLNVRAYQHFKSRVPNQCQRPRMVASLRITRTPPARSPTIRKRLLVVANPQDLVSDSPLHHRLSPRPVRHTPSAHGN